MATNLSNRFACFAGQLLSGGQQRTAVTMAVTRDASYDTESIQSKNSHKEFLGFAVFQIFCGGGGKNLPPIT